MNNPFERYATTVMRKQCKPHQPRVVQSDSEAPLVLRGVMKEIAENDAQFRRYQQHRARECQVLLDSEHGDDVRWLRAALKRLTLESPVELLDVLEQLHWFDKAGDNARFIILGMIDDAICRLRVQNGFSPIDDSLPGEPPTVFEICRNKLQPRGATHENQRHD
jgi:hypothetical protein